MRAQASLFIALGLLLMTLAILTLVSFYYYIALFSHVGNSRKYYSILSQIIGGGLLIRDYKSNLKKIEEYEDEKTLLFLNRIITLTHLATRSITLTVILIICTILLTLTNAN